MSDTEATTERVKFITKVQVEEPVDVDTIALAAAKSTSKPVVSVYRTILEGVLKLQGQPGKAKALPLALNGASKASVRSALLAYATKHYTKDHTFVVLPAASETHIYVAMSGPLPVAASTPAPTTDAK